MNDQSSEQSPQPQEAEKKLNKNQQMLQAVIELQNMRQRKVNLLGVDNRGRDRSGEVRALDDEFAQAYNDGQAGDAARALAASENIAPGSIDLFMIDTILQSLHELMRRKVNKKGVEDPQSSQAVFFTKVFKPVFESCLQEAGSIDLLDYTKLYSTLFTEENMRKFKRDRRPGFTFGQ